MKAVSIANATRRLSAPVDWNRDRDGSCSTLDIVDIDGYMVSAWQPSEAELKRMQEGKPVTLWIRGSAHPVVSVVVPEQ